MGPFNLYDGEAAFFQSISGASRPALLLYAACVCLQEIQDGGFQQFFANPAGIIGPEAIEAFHAMGMPQLAATMQAAVDCLGTPFPRNQQARCSAWQRATQTSHDSDGLQIQTLVHSIELGTTLVYGGTGTQDLYALEDEVYRLCEEENGGFDLAAGRYACATIDA